MRSNLVFAALVLLGPTSFAGTRYVNGSLTTGANDGTSWADAYRGADAVAVALTAAVAGDQVWVAQGTYLPTLTGARTSSFKLKTGVEVYGGFNGSEISLAQRDPSANVTTLSGDLLGDDASSMFNDNSFHVVKAPNTDSTAVLDGFTVSGGNADGFGSLENKQGGGIVCPLGADPTIRRCTFSANRCFYQGGAGFIGKSNATFSDCVFDGNVSSQAAGALAIVNEANATFDRCVFRNNSAGFSGGLLITSASTPKFFNSLFYANTCGGGGGAMYFAASSPLLHNCTIVFNSSTGTAYSGILANGGAPSIVNCVVYGNTGAGGASGAESQVSPTTLAGVSYTLTSTGHPGPGNVAATPVFDNCGPFPYRLSSSSPGVDAGDNAGVAPGIALDLAGAPRFQDVPAVANSGSGTAPLVDIGAFESDPDCNANNISDWCDMDAGTSLDVNGNSIPDECECAGGVAPFTYCTAKMNSQFCVPAIGFVGYASVSSGDPFLITASSILNQKVGLLFYGYLSNAAPFLGATLCVAQPIKRTPKVSSGGTPTGIDCTGTFSFDFNALIASGSDPLLQVVGQQVNAQFWSRDPLDSYTTNTTDAVQFAVCQ